MPVTTYSPGLVLLFVWALLWILMDVHFTNLTPLQKWLVPVLILSLALFNHWLRLRLGSPLYGRVIPLTMHLPFFLIFLYITRCGVIKMIFMILSAFIFTAPTVVVSNLAYRIYPSSAALLIGSLAAYAIALLLAQFVFRRGFNYLLRYGDNQLFVRFSLVPILYYVYAFAIMRADLSSLEGVAGLLARYLPTIQVFLFLFLLLHTYKTLSELREMETARTALTHQLGAAREQLSLLDEAQAQTRIYRHDMRHHLNPLEGYLDAGDSPAARAYIGKVQAGVEALTTQRYCENPLVNLLCSSFAQKARRQELRLEIDARLPEALPLSDTELSSLLSNGLENALTAASAMPEPERWVKLFCSVRLHKLLIEVQNPYVGTVEFRDGLPVSARAGYGHGYGCRSLLAIAQRHNGMCSFTAENGVFCLRLLLPLTPSQP